MFKLPRLFCLRVTDIIDDVNDPEGDRYRMEFEVLNWTNQDAFGLEFSFSADNENFPAGDGVPCIVGASVDAGGRPIGPGNDDANFPPGDGTIGAKIGRVNNWAVDLPSLTSTRVLWRTGSAANSLPALDLFANSGDPVNGTALSCLLIPGCTIVSACPRVVVPETIDNAVGIDNVLDGFVLDIDDWDEGEIFSVCWFLRDVNGQCIGVSGAGNQFGFGAGNFQLVPGAASSGPAVWRRQRSVAEGRGTNTGLSLDRLYIFDQTISNGLAVVVEWGAAVTAPFKNVNDRPSNADVTAEAASPPSFIEPECGRRFIVCIGNRQSHTITVTDPDPDDLLLLEAMDVPNGATFTDALPLLGRGALTTEFRWRPRNRDLGEHCILYTVNDLGGAEVCEITVEVIECLLLIGSGPGQEVFSIGGHDFQTQLSGISRFYPVTIENIPLIRLDPPTGGSSPQVTGSSGGQGSMEELGEDGGNGSTEGQFYAQVVLYNPEIFPDNSDQWSQGLNVSFLPDGTVTSHRFGNKNNLNINYAVVSDLEGNHAITFPFRIIRF